MKQYCASITLGHFSHDKFATWLTRSSIESVLGGILGSVVSYNIPWYSATTKLSEIYEATRTSKSTSVWQFFNQPLWIWPAPLYLSWYFSLKPFSHLENYMQHNRPSCRRALQCAKISSIIMKSGKGYKEFPTIVKMKMRKVNTVALALILAIHVSVA